MAKVLDTIVKTQPGGAVLEVLIDGKPPFGPGGASTRGVTQIAITSNDVATLKLQPMKNGQPDPSFPLGQFALLQPDQEGRCFVLAQWAYGVDGAATYSISAGNAGKAVVNGSGIFEVEPELVDDLITAESEIQLVDPYND